MTFMRTIELWAKKLLIGTVGAFRSSKRISPNQIPLQRLKRILIVKQHDQLGDLLVTTPAVRALRKKFPESYIAIVVREYTAPMIWDNPNVDSVIVFYEKLKQWNWQKFKSFWDQLRSDGGFDCAIMLNSVSRSLSSDMITVASKAKIIIGPNHIALDPDIPESIYNVLTPRARKEQHESEHYLDIVRSLGVQPDGLDYDLQLTDDEEAGADKVLYELGIQSATLLIGVHFGALNKEKRYPLEKFLIPGPNETHHHQQLLSFIKSAEVRSVPVQQMRISCAVIKKLQLLLCNDTGTMHIASALRVPTISFHSISDPAQWKPPHERHISLRADDKKITSITVEMVTAAVRTQLQKLGFKERE
ncbi:MAG: glycosyltransferase family 9 protein [Ignavibacteriales bacterium]|nr:glycosyltransferase family 9 protein [Ignavibacteriales bacterium]